MANSKTLISDQSPPNHLRGSDDLIQNIISEYENISSQSSVPIGFISCVQNYVIQMMLKVTFIIIKKGINIIVIGQKL